MIEYDSDKPRVVTALKVLGWILVVATPIAALASAASAGQLGTPVFVMTLVGGFLSAALIFGLIAVITKLAEIEAHLRLIRDAAKIGVRHVANV